MIPSRPSKNFRGGNDYTVPAKDFLGLFADLFSLAGYARSTYRKMSWSWKKGYSNNLEFWNDVLAGRLPEGKRVTLKDFFVTAWVPTSPGLYFTPEAAEARVTAGEYYSEETDEYLQLGKNAMVLGGVGSVRLKSRSIHDDRCHFLSASSTGVSHEGMPLVTKHTRFADLDLLNNAGGFKAHIQGTLWSLPEELKLIRHAGGVPKYYLFVDRMDVERPCEPEEALATVAVMYPTSREPYVPGNDGTRRGDYRNLLSKGWTFCSFDPSGGLKVVRDAAAWMKGYASRHMNLDAPFFSDFDELYNHFGDSVEFPLRQIQDGLVDPLRLSPYQDRYGFQFSEGAAVLVDQTRIGVHMGSNNVYLGGVTYESVAANDVIKLAFNEPTGVLAKIDEVRNRLATCGELPDGVADDDLRQVKEAVFRSDRPRVVKRLKAARDKLLQAGAEAPAATEAAAKLDALLAVIAAG